jgi:signal transduction histidine kinase
MSALKSSVLILAHPAPHSVQFGADFAASLNEVSSEAATYPVIVFPSSEIRNDQDFQKIEAFNSRSPLCQNVIIHDIENITDNSESDRLRKLINNGHVFKVLASFADLNFERVIQEALDEYMLAQQNTRLLQVVNDQNERLKRLSMDLEERVEKRQRFLEDTRAKLLVTNHRVEALHRAFVAVHRAKSIVEMERLINEALSGALGLNGTRILFQSQSAQSAQSQLLSERGQISIFSTPLTDARASTREPIGSIHFAREKERPFSKDETVFLIQVADAVALSMDRLLKLEQSETLKGQWDATFDAILEPVSLIDENYTILRTNRAYALKAGTTSLRVIGQKCFEVLFARKSPCDNCQIGANFRLNPSQTQDGQTTIFNVFSQTIQFKPESKSLFVNMYRDISEQIRLERQVVESAKMAELGTIGSSIAHELNNPLGGILSFLQLIKMDLTGNENFAGDINDMEQGARRCRDIVENLLGFSRKSSYFEEPRNLDLREVVKQALKITELQTRAMGIEVKLDIPARPLEMNGKFNDLAQAFRGFLQNAQEGIATKAKSNRYQAEIAIRIYQEDKKYFIEIRDNGAEPSDRTTSLGLTVALQIITDHSGRLENFTQTVDGTWAKISFPTPT